MDSIRIMMAEHEQILRVLDALDAFAESAQGSPGDQVDLGHFVDFIREYADERHHGKEEAVLFEAMVRNGFPRDAGPVGAMIQEHEEMRQLVKSLRSFADQEAAWTLADRERVAGAARSYTSTLREHIMKENEMLYPMAEEQLVPAVQDEVDRDCAALDARQAASGTGARLEKLAAHLVAHFGEQRRSGPE